MDSEWLVIAAIILAAMSKPALPWGTGWLWPIPTLLFHDTRINALTPAVSQEFRGGGPSPHYGVDLMYKGPAGYFVPDGAVPVLAARDGKLWSIQRTARGWGIVLDHGPPWATYYQHLDSVSPDVAAMQRGAPIRAGQPLGVMGSDPTDGGHVRHLHFAVWYQGHGDQASVEPDMRTWRVAAFTMPDVAEV